MKAELENFEKEILNGNLQVLSKAITFAESQKAEHQEFAQTLIQNLYSKTGNAKRIAITGVPGVGKSTFINSFGQFLVEQGNKVAVLAIDPSSSISGGSILGDKTRMEELTKLENVFIRPSATAGTLGGITNRTYESILLCEAAGFDIILIETVGVGQTEFEVKDITDCFILLKVIGTGDELQGIKRGIMEMADFIFINKTDNFNESDIQQHKIELNRSKHFARKKPSNWETKILTGSGLAKKGFEELSNQINTYFELIKESKFLYNNRQQQKKKQTEKYLLELFQKQISNKLNPQILIDDLENISAYNFAKNLFEQ